MVRNPYKIEGPACISFSGGRSSGYMLKHVLDAHGGTLPDDVYVLFANTGKEMEESLQFVAACGEMWDVPIVWLEYDPTQEGNTRVVTYGTASRNGEPFHALIEKRRYLPNPVTRFCTEELKIRRFRTWMRKVAGHKHWDSIIGYRGDEPRRVSKMRARNDKGKEPDEMCAPMVECGVTTKNVIDWWAEQPFDLTLPHNGVGKTLAGNCDLCFLKGLGTARRLVGERPHLADWWAEQEASVTGLTKKESGEWFRKDRPGYAAIKQGVLSGKATRFFQDGEDGGISCFCGD